MAAAADSTDVDVHVKRKKKSKKVKREHTAADNSESPIQKKIPRVAESENGSEADGDGDDVMVKMDDEERRASARIDEDDEGDLLWSTNNDMHLLKSILTFCSHMEKETPEKPVLLKNIPWQTISSSFENSPPAELLQKRYSLLCHKVRKQRTVQEVATDAKQLLTAAATGKSSATTFADCNTSISKKLFRERTGCPKRPLSAYLLFCNERRPSIAKENPNMLSSEVMKALGAEWKTLSESEMERLKNMNQAALDEYKNKLESWKEKYMTDDKKLSRSKASSLKHCKKGLPINVLELFFRKQQKSDINETDLAVSSVVSQWLNLSTKEQERVKEEFCASLEENDFIDLAFMLKANNKQPTSSAAKAAWKEFEASHAKPPVTAYGMFSEKFTGLFDPDVSFQEKLKRIKEKWLALKDSKKQRLMKKFSKKVNGYKAELLEYLDSLPVHIGYEIAMQQSVLNLMSHDTL